MNVSTATSFSPGRTRRILITAAGAALLGLLSVPPAQAQGDWPAGKVITWVVFPCVDKPSPTFGNCVFVGHTFDVVSLTRYLDAGCKRTTSAEVYRLNLGLPVE